MQTNLKLLLLDFIKEQDEFHGQTEDIIDTILLVGEKCFGKLIPKRIKILMDTSFRMIQRDFDISNITTRHKNKSENCFFSLIFSY